MPAVLFILIFFDTSINGSGIDATREKNRQLFYCKITLF